ncbi:MULTISPECIES: hypothetical protein [unclassified Bradyrhizobium]|uniref:hypothetical protein n=1 Tax=unclassified Bradyrhizobium TaxID=2631580 RepID=UPI0020B235B0|nr:MULTISPECIES: hypothetical protein [unclassified Bradyrhizobium]MCP3397800.1 hypothetical protein [Bradyrhizobium sp. CCGB20]MCP3406389.1 hypothetical protein [Bradyrhizobium sp. CCGB01]
MDTVFAIEERADSARISPAHQPVEFGKTAAFEQSNDGAPVSVPMLTQVGVLAARPREKPYKLPTGMASTF